MKANEYIINCISRILMADCAPSERHRRNIAIALAVQIAANRGIFAAHNHLRRIVEEAEAGAFAEQPEAARDE